LLKDTKNKFLNVYLSADVTFFAARSLGVIRLPHKNQFVGTVDPLLLLGIKKPPTMSGENILTQQTNLVILD